MWDGNGANANSSLQSSSMVIQKATNVEECDVEQWAE